MALSRNMYIGFWLRLTQTAGWRSSLPLIIGATDRCVKMRRLSKTKTEDEIYRRDLYHGQSGWQHGVLAKSKDMVEGTGRRGVGARGGGKGGGKGVARKKSLIGRAGPAGTNFCFPSFPVSALRPPISHKFELIYMHLNLMHRHALSKQLSF